MKLLIAFLTAFLAAGWAQVPVGSVVIKQTVAACPLVALLRFSPNGRELVRECAFGPVAMFDTSSYRTARTFLSEIEHTPELTDLAYSPDGRMLATARGRSGAAIWNAADHGRPVDAKAASFFGVDKLYALDTPIRSLEASLGGASVDWIAFSPDGKLLITAHSDGDLKIWNTGSWTAQGTVAVKDGSLNGLTVEPDSKRVLVSDGSGALHEWDLKSKTEIRTLRAPGGRPARNLQFSADGKTLVAILEGNTLAEGSAIIWNTKDWSAKTQSVCNSAAFSPDGKLLAFGGSGHIKLIERDSRKEVRDIKLPDVSMAELLPGDAKQPGADKKIPSAAIALAFSPDGKKIAAGFVGGMVRLFDANP